MTKGDGGKGSNNDRNVIGDRLAAVHFVNLRHESFGNGAMNDEVYGSSCGRCPVFIHDLLYSPRF